jgi:uncharacterized protein with PIN domain
VKFLCDDNLGKLAKYLRVLGYDTFFRSEIEDRELLSIALNEDRIILTRDLKLRELKSSGKVILINSYDPLQQLSQVINEFQLRPRRDRSFTRCLDCNTELVQVKKEDYSDRIPPYVFRTQDRFLHCKRCDKIFWGGTHVQRMSQKLSEFLSD